MRVPFIRRAYLLLALLLGLTAASPRATEAQGQCWQIELCPTTAPAVTIDAATQVSVATIPLAIYFSDPEALDLFTLKLWKNGNVASSWYAGASGPSASYEHFSADYTGPFTLSVGANVLIAEICDAWSPSTCGRDTVTITYTPPPPPPTTAKPVLALMQRSDARDVDTDAATHDYATTPYFSLDAPRGVVLHYSSATARPSAEIHVDAVVRSSQIPTAISIRVTRSDTIVVFPERFFQGDTGVLRLAAKFDDSCGGASACAKLYRVAVRAYYGNASTFETDSLPSVRVLIQDESASRLGAGWTMAGVERLHVQSDGIVVTNGAGLLEYFAKTGCTGSAATEACDYASPVGDLSVLKRTPAHPLYATRFFRAYKNGDTTYFDNTGLVRRIRTRFAAAATRFAWSTDSVGARVDTIVDPLGKAIRLAYEPLSGATYRNGSLRWITLPDSRATGVRVSNAMGDLTRIDGPDGVADLVSTYDASSHRLSTFTLRVGGGAIAYDAYDRVAKVSGVAVALEAGGTGADSILYHARIKRTLTGSSATYGSVTTKPLRADSAFSRSISSNGAEVSLWTHALGGPAMVRSRSASGDTTVARTSYDAVGRVASSSVTGQAPTSYGYDATYGALNQVVNGASGEVTSIGFGPYGQPQTVYVNGVLQSRAFYSGAGLAPDSVRTDTATTTRFKYDAYGRLTSVRDARQAVDSSTYDPASGNLASSRSTAPGQALRVVSLLYDASGRAMQLTDHLGRVVTTAYDVLNRTTLQIGLGTDTTAWTYNDVSTLYTFRDPNNNIYQTQLNAAGWVTTETDPYGASSTFGYDRRGNVTRVTDRRGQVVRWYKDALDRDTLRVAGTDSTRFAYDPAQRWVAVRNAESTDTVRVDAAGRPSAATTVRGAVKIVTTRGWIGTLPDAVSWQATSGGTTLWTRTIGTLYDAARRARTVVDFAGVGTQTAFDQAGAEKSVALANNISTRTNTFSTRSELTQMSFTGAAGVFARTYQHDASSRIWQILHGAEGDSYSRLHNYDSRDRLQDYRDTHTWTETTWEAWDPYGDCPGCFIQVDVTHVDTLRAGAYTYDKIGNRIGGGRTYADTGRSRLTAVGSESFTYDAEGHLLQRSGGAMGTVQYRWNALGQLDTVKVLGGATTVYGYDGVGQRVRKTVNGVTTRYVLHDGQVALELDATGGIVAEYTYYAGTDRPHGMRRGGVQYFYVQDAEGNVSGLLNASGAVVETYTYTPQGELVGGGGGVTNPYRYKGREWDAEAGLYYMRARYYDPGTSRFLSEDPIGLAGGLNPYVFGEADPVNNMDPTGTSVCEIQLGRQWTEVRDDGAIVVMSERNRLVCSTASGSYFRNLFDGWRDAVNMLGEFISGRGPSDRYFYEGSTQVEQLRDAPGVRQARGLACESFRRGEDPRVRLAYDFGLIGLASAGWNPTRQFVGSYVVRVVPGQKGTMTFIVRNATSMTSAAYHRVGSWERDYFAPGGTIRQSYVWMETNGVCGGGASR